MMMNSMFSAAVLFYRVKKDIKSTIPFYYDIPNAQGIMKHYKITVNADFTEIFPAEGTKYLPMKF
jgi:hypothetical protein